MAIEKTDETIVTQEPATTGTPPDIEPRARETVRTASRQTTIAAPGRSEMARRITVFVFGLIQLVIGLRIVLLVLDARSANGLVSGILDVSEIFVAPFDGILRTNALQSAGSILDISAIVAFVGWTILELIVLWVVAIFRRDPATAAA